MVVNERSLDVNYHQSTKYYPRDIRYSIWLLCEMIQHSYLKGLTFDLGWLAIFLSLIEMMDGSLYLALVFH